jgi:hypothetical protein
MDGEIRAKTIRATHNRQGERKMRRIWIRIRPGARLPVQAGESFGWTVVQEKRGEEEGQQSTRSSASVAD